MANKINNQSLECPELYYNITPVARNNEKMFEINPIKIDPDKSSDDSDGDIIIECNDCKSTECDQMIRLCDFCGTNECSNQIQLCQDVQEDLLKTCNQDPTQFDSDIDSFEAEGAIKYRDTSSDDSDIYIINECEVCKSTKCDSIRQEIMDYVNTIIADLD